jgi:uncharacterized short protein YbdD (DUF466 family)
MTRTEQRKKILKQLKALKGFPNTKTVRKLRKELQVKLKRIESKVEKPKQTRLRVSRKEIQRQANLARSRKVHKYHNYIKQISNNYPDLTYSQIRKQFKERKKGKHTEIPDVVWFNPSP